MSAKAKDDKKLDQGNGTPPQTPPQQPEQVQDGEGLKNGEAPKDYSHIATLTGGIDEDALEEEAGPVVGEQQSYVDAMRIEELEAEVKSLKEQRAHLVGEVDRLQRNPSPPKSPSPTRGEGDLSERKWVVNIIQTRIGQADFNLDYPELAEKLNDGWEIVHQQVNSLRFEEEGWPQITSYMIVTLRKLVEVEPEPDGGAKVEIEETPSPPQSPSPTGGEGDAPSDDGGAVGKVMPQEAVDEAEGVQAHGDPMREPVPFRDPAGGGEPKVMYIMPGQSVAREYPREVDLEGLTYERAVREHIPLSSADMKRLADRDLVEAFMTRNAERAGV